MSDFNDTQFVDVEFIKTNFRFSFVMHSRRKLTVARSVSSTWEVKTVTLWKSFCFISHNEEENLVVNI